MKALVCGKGGSGKSTVVALLATELEKRGRKVLILDSDESNFALGSLLGMPKPADFMEYFGGKKVLFDRVKTIENELASDQLPAGYLSEKGAIRLLAVGKIYDFGEGCACSINALAAKLLENLRLREDEILLADTDAGVEHLGRGVEKGCDILFVIVEPSRESIGLAQRVTEMMKESGKRVYYVLNKTDSETEKILRNALDPELIVAAIPSETSIFRSGLEGKQVSSNAEGIGEIADFLAGGVKVS